MRILLLFLLFATGCDTSFGPEAKHDSAAVSANQYASPSFESGIRTLDKSSSFGGEGPTGAEGPAIVSIPSASETLMSGKSAPVMPTTRFVERKIIYNARMGLVVENFDGLDKKIAATIDQHDGYLANVNLDQMQGQQRSGQWTARIPVDQYRDFLTAMGQLGVPTNQEESSDDVTEEFVDLGARIENKKKLEARIVQLLERPDDEIQHVIEVERELARVREEIERMEGRLRYLADQTAMTTVHVFAREEQDYQPPQAPTFDNRISSAWNNSIIQTGNFIQNTIVFLVGNAIGIVFFFFALLIFLIVGRRFWRKWDATESATEPTGSTPS